MSPAFLRFVKACVDAAAEAGKPLAVCGEMAGRPLEALALVALGITSLSMQPHAIGPVKQAILSADAGALRAWLLPRLDSAGHTLRQDFMRHAELHGVWLGRSTDCQKV